MIKFDEILSDDWKDIINKNLKWSVTFFIRLMTLFLYIFIVFHILKWTGVIDKYSTSTAPVTIKDTKTENQTKQTKEVYTSDEKDINDLLTILKNKKGAK